MKNGFYFLGGLLDVYKRQNREMGTGFPGFSRILTGGSVCRAAKKASDSSGKSFLMRSSNRAGKVFMFFRIFANNCVQR